MNFNRCERCGCFFASNDHVCPNCAPKDHFEKVTLKDYLEHADQTLSLYDMCIETGISEKNMNRYLQSDEFKNYLQGKQNTSGNISINL